jgi:DNA polymerase III sliding clamp (beta) subunit (PCNA family)
MKRIILTVLLICSTLSDSASSALVEDGDAGGEADAEALYVVMPMRL